MIDGNSDVLLVDDFEMIRMLVSRELKKLGINKIHEAEDGQEAFNKLEELSQSDVNVGLIICDWTMPNVDGLEFLQMCKKSDAYKDIPFVMLTAESEKKNVIKAISMGLTSYIVKPLEPGTLEHKLTAINAKLAETQASE